jgi:pyoverdine/dityrosine biosynthesis protein Dit1
MLTHCGRIKFLQSEMETSAALIGLGSSAKIRLYKKTAKTITRSKAFTCATGALFPRHVRLSMHPSSGASKLPVTLISVADGGFQKSPWHDCVAMEFKDQPACVHSEDFRGTHDLIPWNERP